MTAVEFLVDKLKSQGLLIGEPYGLVAVREAKEMEKQQIIDAILFSEKEHIVQSDCYPPQFIVDKAEYYYNETFKKQVK